MMLLSVNKATRLLSRRNATFDILWIGPRDGSYWSTDTALVRAWPWARYRLGQDVALGATMTLRAQRWLLGRSEATVSPSHRLKVCLIVPLSDSQIEQCFNHSIHAYLYLSLRATRYLIDPTLLVSELELFSARYAMSAFSSSGASFAELSMLQLAAWWPQLAQQRLEELSLELLG